MSILKEDNLPPPPPKKGNLGVTEDLPPPPKKKISDEPVGVAPPLPSKFGSTVGAPPSPLELTGGTSVSAPGPLDSQEPTGPIKLPTEAEWEQIQKSGQAPTTLQLRITSPLGKVTQKTINVPQIIPGKEFLGPVQPIKIGTKEEQIKEQETIVQNQKELSGKKLKDFYDTYQQTKGTVGDVLDVNIDKQNTLDLYNDYLMNNDPSELKYLTSRQQESQKDYLMKISDPTLSEEEKKKLQLDTEKYEAELYNRALNFKASVFAAKYEEAKNEFDLRYKEDFKLSEQYANEQKGLSENLKAVADRLSKFEKTDQGFIPKSPEEQKEIQQLITAHNEMVGQYKDVSGKLDQINSEPGFNESMNKINSVHDSYEKLTKEAETFIDQYPELKKKLSEVKSKQAAIDILADVNPEFDKFTKTGGQVIGAVTGFLQKLSYVPKMVGDGDEFGWTDKFYDSSADMFEELNSTIAPMPTKLTKPLFENGKLDAELILPKTIRTLSDMGLLVGSAYLTGGTLAAGGVAGGLASSIGTVLAGTVLTAEDYYKDAKAAGMNESDANNFAFTVSIQQGMLELINPEMKLFNKGLFGTAAKTYVDRLAKGVTKKVAMQDASKILFKNVIGENVQETMQFFDELGNKDLANTITGVKMQTDENIGDALAEQFVLTTLVSLPFGGLGVRGANQLQKESLYLSALNPMETTKAIQEMVKNGTITEEKSLELGKIIDNASTALTKMPASMDVMKKINALPLMMEKMKMEEDAKGTDSSFKPIVDEKIDAITKEVQDSVGIVEPKTETDGKEEKAGKETGKKADVLKAPKSEEQPAPLNQDEMDELEFLQLSDKEGVTTPEDKTRMEELVKRVPEVKAETKEAPIVTQEVVPVKETTASPEVTPAPEVIAEPVAKTEKEVFDEKKSTIDTKTNLTDIKDLEVGDYVAVKNDSGNVYEGFVTKIGPKNVSVEGSSMYGISETKFKKDNIEGFYKPKTEPNAKEGGKETQGASQETRTVGETQERIRVRDAEQAKEEVAPENVVDDKDVISTLDKDLDAIKKLPADKTKMKSTAVNMRINQAVKEGKLTKESAYTYRKSLDETVVERGKKETADRKQRIKDAISVGAELLKQDLEDLNIISSQDEDVKKSGFVDARKLIDLAVKIAHKSIDAGFSVAESVEKALKSVKGSVIFKKMVDAKIIDEKEFDAGVGGVFQKAEKQEQKDEEKKKDEKKNMKTAERVATGEFIDKDIKSGLEEKGYKYVPTSLKITNDDASAYVKAFEESDKLDKANANVMNMQNGMRNDVRGTIAANLVEAYERKKNSAETLEERQDAIDNIVGLTVFAAELFNDSGLTINAAKLWKRLAEKTPEGMVAAVRKHQEKEREKIIDPKRKDLKDAKAALEEVYGEDVERIIEVRVAEEIEKRGEALFGKETKKKIVDFFDSFKIDTKGKLYDATMGLPIAIYNGAVEILKKSSLLGASTANAIKAAKDYVNSNWKNAWLDKDFELTWKERMEGEDTPIPKKKPLSETQKSTILERWEKRLSNLSEENRRQLLADSVEELNTIGALSDKRFEEFYAKAMGLQTMTNEMMQKVLQLSSVIGKAETASRAFEKSFDDQIVAEKVGPLTKEQKVNFLTEQEQKRKEWEKAVFDAEIANRELSELFRGDNRFWDTMTSLMQLNLLTTKSLITNIYANALIQPLMMRSEE